ncbi:beta-galactosidase [Bifidobacterium saguini DSM 23967]|uniref:beta-galactosidase n=2 Tax=Bifidobacterium saguini TaxID=762210 RepID=A0A087D8G6_9BIFI|nr:glycoside hydrolase family 2 [Bifidobacterium saguini]KFI91816.1 beta-galactosidase [Bifidobacterium saguini DSM 23967]QTB90171.1 glycoside hydrolase family 2 [Bifidobacterium saguini]
MNNQQRRWVAGMVSVAALLTSFSLPAYANEWNPEQVDATTSHVGTAATTDAAKKRVLAMASNGDFAGYINYAYKQSVSMDQPQYQDSSNNHSADHAVDGDSTTIAQASAGQKFALTITLNEVVELNTITIKNKESKLPINKYTISYSSDGQNWTDLEEQSVSDDEKQNLTAIASLGDKPVKVKAFKVAITDAATWFAITEIGAYNTDKLRDIQADVASGTELRPGSQVRLASPDSDAAIHYTTDGSQPTEKSAEYRDGITIDRDVKIRAIAVQDGRESSNIAEFEYAVQKVYSSVAPGRVKQGTKIGLRSAWSDAKIYYTTDGSDPKTQGKLYDGTEFKVDGFLSIKAYAKVGDQASHAYTLLFSTTNLPADMKLTFSASSAQNGQAADKVADDDATTGWVPVEQNQDNQWIKVDMGAPFDFDGISLTWPQANGGYLYKIEVSDNDVAYRTYYEGTSTGATDSVPLAESHIRYMRIRVLGAASGAIRGLNEWQIFGAKSTDGVNELTMKGNSAKYDRVVVNKIPEQVAGVKTPVLSLNGTWKATLTPQNAFWRDSTDTSAWKDAQVPGDLDSQGFPVYYPDDPNKHDTAWGNGHVPWWPGNNIETPYKRQIDVPADYKGKKVFLRIDKAFNYSRVWVNGHFVRDHRGAYNSYDADITDYVKPGETNWITISTIAEGNTFDNEGDTSYSGAYGFFEFRHTRGLVGDISMYATPASYVNRVQVDTDLDDEYKDATLKLTTSGVLASGKTNATVKFSLKDADGKTVPLKNDTISLKDSLKDQSISNHIENPLKWDAEHPNLYQLTTKVQVDGKTVETFNQKIGFREVQVKGNKFLVNGVPTKMRGFNFQAYYGVESMDELGKDWQTQKRLLEKVKELNGNFIRASHFPINDQLLELCDELGIYVEQENSITFVGEFAAGAAYQERYREYIVHTANEMVEKDRSHASIVMWSLANESNWGQNMAEEAEYVKTEDPTRPTIFSWGGRVADHTNVDVLSYHYHNGGDGIRFAESTGKPVIWDEYAHGFISGSINKLQYNPGYREHYYQTILADWSQVYSADNFMGGAIWNLVDYYNEGLNQTNGGVGTWGQLDIWGREKPEGYATKNVYSPVQYQGANAIDLPNDNTAALKLNYENRYETVDFGDNDFAVYATVSNQGETRVKRTKISGIALSPKTKGDISIPAPKGGWQYGDQVQLEFEKTTSGITRNVITHIVTIGTKSYAFPASYGNAPRIEEHDNEVKVVGSNFDIAFSKATGLITAGNYDGNTLLVGGPYLNVDYRGVSGWTLSSLQTETTRNGTVKVIIAGTYDSGHAVTFNLTIDGQGKIVTDYTITANGTLWTYELGVAYDSAPNMDKVSWNRNGYFTYYPDYQYGVNDGTADRTVTYKRQYGVRPPSTAADGSFNADATPWKLDDKDFFDFGNSDQGNRGTNDFRGSKNNIYYAEAGFSGNSGIVSVEGTGTGAIKPSVNADGSVHFGIDDWWGYPASDLEYHKSEWGLTGTYSGSVTIRLGNQSKARYANYVSADTSKRLTIAADNNVAAVTADHGTLDFNVIHGTEDVQWHVLDTDGKKSSKAVINADGLLKAQANGYVVVKAVAKDGTGTSDAVIVSITGQSKSDKSDLKTALAEAEKLKQSDYTPATWKVFAQALADAEAIVKDDSADQVAVDNALQALTGSQTALVKKASVKALEAVIDLIGKLDSTKFTDESWSALQSAVDAGKKLADDPNAAQSDVDAAVVSIQTAVQHLQVKQPTSELGKVDKTGLEALIKVVDSGVLDLSQYTDESVSALNKALVSARAVFKDKDATQQRVDTAVTELSDALSGLERKTATQPGQSDQSSGQLDRVGQSGGINQMSATGSSVMVIAVVAIMALAAGLIGIATKYSKRYCE